MTTEPPRVLVTGGTGFLGRAIVRRLTANGCRIRLLVRPATPPEKLAGVVGAEDAVEVAPTSFGDAVALKRALSGIEVVVHAAASKQGSVAAQVANTVVGSEALFKAALDEGVRRVVVVGSMGALASATVPRDGLVDEDTPLEPHPEWRDPYTFAKVKQEQLARKFEHERGLKAVLIRPGVIFGPGQSLLSSRVGVSAFGAFLHLGQGMTVPMTYVDNCAEAVVLACWTPSIDGRSYCIVDDDLPTSRYLLRLHRRRFRRTAVVPIPAPARQLLAQLNDWYSRATEGHLPPVFTPYKVNAMWRGHRYSNKRAKAELGWVPHVSMQDALIRTLEP